MDTNYRKYRLLSEKSWRKHVYLKRVEVNFPQVRNCNNLLFTATPNDFSCSLGTCKWAEIIAILACESAKRLPYTN